MNLKKPYITFAQVVCLLIIIFGLGYHGLVTFMAFYHTPIPSLVNEIKGDVNIWMTSAISFAIGSSVNSQRKDATIASMQDNISTALQSTPPDAGKAPTPTQTLYTGPLPPPTPDNP